MKFSRYLVKSIVVIMVSLLGALPVLGDELDKAIDKVLKSSGIAGQLDGLAEAVLVSVPLDAFPDSKMKSESASFLKEFAAKESLVALVRESVRQDVDRDCLEKVSDFYDSRLGKKVGRAQDSALDANVLKTIRESRTLSVSLGESRATALQRIVVAERVSEVNAVWLHKMVEGITEGYLGETQVSENEAEAMRKQVKLVFDAIEADRTRSKETARVAFAYTYRSLDDKELEEFAKFSESEPAARFRTAVQLGLDKAVSQTARALGTAVARWRLQTDKPATEKRKRRTADDNNPRSQE